MEDQKVKELSALFEKYIKGSHEKAENCFSRIEQLSGSTTASICRAEYVLHECLLHLRMIAALAAASEGEGEVPLRTLNAITEVSQRFSTAQAAKTLLILRELDDEHSSEVFSLMADIIADASRACSEMIISLIESRRGD